MDFIIKKPTSSNRTVRMPDTLIEKITELAARMDVSLVRWLIQRDVEIMSLLTFMESRI